MPSGERGGRRDGRTPSTSEPPPCLAKQLLRHLAGDEALARWARLETLSREDRAVGLARLATSHCFRRSSGVAVTGEMTLEDYRRVFYGDAESEEPSGFGFFEPGGLGAIASQLSLHLVIFRGPRGDVVKHCDTRVLGLSCKRENGTFFFHVRAEGRGKKARHYMVGAGTEAFALREFGYSPSNSEQHLMTRPSHKVSGCFLRTLL